jgi:hypothetical protein
MANDLSTLFRAILLAALFSGTLDITAACTQAYFTSGVPPMRVLHFVASGVFGQSAFTSGMQGASAGLGLHYLIAYSWAVLIFFLYPYLLKILPNIARNLALIGIVYGVFVWCVMNLIVLPNSNMPQRPLHLVNASIGAGIIVVCIGIPLVWSARRFYDKHPSLLAETLLANNDSTEA